MSKQAIRTIRQANNYVAPTIEKYAKINWGRIVAGLGVLALTASLTGCPSRGEVKKPPAQIVDGGRMSDGSQQTAVKQPEKKEEQNLSKLKPRKIEIEVKGKKIIFDIEQDDYGLGGKGLRGFGPKKRDPNDLLPIH